MTFNRGEIERCTSFSPPSSQSSHGAHQWTAIAQQASTIPCTQPKHCARCVHNFTNRKTSNLRVETMRVNCKQKVQMYAASRNVLCTPGRKRCSATRGRLPQRLAAEPLKAPANFDDIGLLSNTKGCASSNPQGSHRIRNDDATLRGWENSDLLRSHTNRPHSLFHHKAFCDDATEVFVEDQELHLSVRAQHPNSHPPVWQSPTLWATGHKSRHTATCRQGKRWNGHAGVPFSCTHSKPSPPDYRRGQTAHPCGTSLNSPPRISLEVGRPSTNRYRSS